jgi:N-acetylneuraminic acid mutarotase
MKSLIRNILLFCSLSFFVNCNGDEITVREYPRLLTLAVTEVTAEGAQFNAQITYRGDFEVINYGFVWGETENPTIENSDRVINEDNIETNNYSVLVESTLKTEASYFVRAFVQTNDFLVYGENTRFLSLGSKGPELIDFYPKAGHLNDTIKIIGSNFGRCKSNIKVEIGTFSVDIIDFNETEISVIVPDLLSEEKSSLSISVAGNTTTFDSEFVLIKPIISSISSLNVTFGSILKIEGANFNTKANKVKIVFKGTNADRFPAEILSITDKLIETRIPLNISKESDFIILMNNFEVISSQKIKILDPIITSFSPNSAKTLSEITIVGQNFSSLLSNNIVRIDGYPVEIINVNQNELVVKLPDQSDHIYSTRQVEVSVEVLSTSVVAENQLSLTDKWLRRENLSFFNVQKAVTINNDIYLLTTFDIQKYNVANDTWSTVSAFPFDERFDQAIFTIDNYIYVGTGFSFISGELYNDLWEYNTETDLWTQKADFPGGKRASTISFNINNKGFIGAGYEDYTLLYELLLNDFWKYNQENDSWSEVSKYPRVISGSASTVFKGEAYVAFGRLHSQEKMDNKIFKYNEQNDEWTRIQDFPGSVDLGGSGGSVTTIKNDIFFSHSDHENLWSFNGNIWKAYESITTLRIFKIAIESNDIGYFGGVDKQFWSFNPSQPD